MANLFPQKDDWDWPYILYAGIVFLNMPEADVWNLTPRKLKALLEVHAEVQALMNGTKPSGTRQKASNGLTFIDQVPGW